MSWSDRRSVLTGFGALAGLALSGCDFRPIYGDGTAATALQGKVVLSDVGSRADIALRDRLEQRLGRLREPVYRLDVSVEISSEGLAITQDFSITRYNLTAVADFALIRLSDSATMIADTARSFTAYSATSSPYSTRVAEQEAYRRLSVVLADQIATRIAAAARDFAP